MRTFHVGGVARLEQQSKHIAAMDGKVKYIDLQGHQKPQGRDHRRRNASRRWLSLTTAGAKSRLTRSFTARRFMVEDGQMVKEDDMLATWDPFTFAILTEVSGTIKYQDLKEGKTVEEEIDKVSGQKRLVVKDSGRKTSAASRNPQAAIKF